MTPFTDDDLKRLKMYPASLVDTEALIERLEAAELALDEAGSVADHPAFTVGTKSCDELPRGIMPRIESFRKAEEAWRKAAGK